MLGPASAVDHHPSTEGGRLVVNWHGDVPLQEQAALEGSAVEPFEAAFTQTQFSRAALMAEVRRLRQITPRS